MPAGTTERKRELGKYRTLVSFNFPCYFEPAV